MPLETRRLIVDFDAASSVRHAVGPTAGFVLEALALEAPVGPSLVEVACSSRTLGELLDLSKDTVARALRRLAATGIVERIDHRDTRSGRFEASLYRVDLAVAGLHVDSDAGRPTASADTSARQPRRVQPDLPHAQLSLLN